MSLYNMFNGVNPATFALLPMLGKHPEEYPRFRDCFVGKVTNHSTEKNKYGIPKKITEPKECLSLYLRIGGNNREEYKEQIEELKQMPTYKEDYDDDFDNTFAFFLFGIPKKWELDFDILVHNNLDITSNKITTQYKKEFLRVYPKLEKRFKEKTDFLG